MDRIAGRTGNIANNGPFLLLSMHSTKMIYRHWADQ